MKVYRVENPQDGLGPYQYGVVDWRHYDEEKCPSPSEDGMPFPYGAREYYFGCLTKTALKKWFDLDALETFEQQGLLVYEYDVPLDNVLVGKKQIAFKKDVVYSKKHIPTKKLTLH